jgi:probable rRNA maturation factor
MTTSAPRRIVDIDGDRTSTSLSARDAKRVVETVLRVERVRDALLSVAFVSNREIAAINRRHLRRRGATDVISLSYSQLTAGRSLVGAIYVAPDVARTNAQERGVPLREEIVRLLVHGTLHVLGYDHPEHDGRERSSMWKRQELLVRKSMKLIAR